MRSVFLVLEWCARRIRHRVAGAGCADKGRGAIVRAAALLAALALIGPGVSSAGAQSMPPDERWRTLDTEHFRVTFPAPLDSLARVAGARAERAYQNLSALFSRPPSGRVELVLTDHADFSNGSARVAPFMRLVIFARPPVDGFGLSHMDDWIELVVTHELAHVYHLDLGSGLPSILRRMFGRVPSRWPFFPELASPGWIVEGIATWQESALTESGRVRGTEHEMILRAAILEGGFEDLGQMSGESPVWPGGSRAYIYGSLFIDYLARRFGPAAVAAFMDGVAGQWIPYRLNAAARDAFGVSFSEAWEDWRASLVAEVSALTRRLSAYGAITEPTPVTTGARQAFYPQVSPDSRTLLFSRSDGQSDPQLRAAAPDGSDQRQLTRTNGQSLFSWMPDGGVVYSQYQFDGPYRIRNDLHVRTPDGHDRRVTHDARLDHPSPTPDGRSVIAVRFGPAASTLVEVDLASGEARELPNLESTALWAFPRVSPDGRWIAASRWRPGAYYDVVVLDRTGRLVAEVTRDRALDVAPAWSPDGRWLLWGSDRSGIPNVLATQVGPEGGLIGGNRQVTNVLTGVAFPSVDPSGRWIYLSVSHFDGWDVGRVPFDPNTWTAPQPEDPRFRAEEPYRPVPPLPTGEVRGYSPLGTLRPRYWEPAAEEPITIDDRTIVGTAFGFATEGSDLVGRHTFDLSALYTTTGQGEGALSYSYAGLGNPILSVGAEQVWDADGPLVGERTATIRDTLWVRERDRDVSVAATYRIPGFRVASSVTLSGGVVWESRELLDNNLEPTPFYRLSSPTARLADYRATFSISSARAYTFSMGAAEGALAVLQARSRRHLALPDSSVGVTGEDRGFDELVLRTQIYESFPAFGFTNHVLALRGNAGVAGGPAATSTHFRVGGASGTREPITGFALFGASTYQFAVRGYESGARRGRYAWSGTAEYRVPVWLIDRGLGLFPLSFDRLGATLFVDAGNAWGAVASENPRLPALFSAGGEVVTDLLTFYNIPVTLRAGLAFPLVERDASRPAGLTPQLYLRFGRSF